MSGIFAWSAGTCLAQSGGDGVASGNAKAPPYGAGVPEDMVTVLHRCAGFNPAPDGSDPVDELVTNDLTKF